MTNLAKEFVDDVLSHLSNLSTPFLNIEGFSFTTKYYSDSVPYGETLSSNGQIVGFVAGTISRNGEDKSILLSGDVTVDDIICGTAIITAINSPTEFVVDDASIFPNNSYVEIGGYGVPDFFDNCVVSKSGNVVTTKFPITSEIGKKIRLKISGYAVVYNENKVYKWISEARFKDSTMAFPITHRINLS